MFLHFVTQVSVPEQLLFELEAQRFSVCLQTSANTETIKSLLCKQATSSLSFDTIYMILVTVIVAVYSKYIKWVH